MTLLNKIDSQIEALKLKKKKLATKQAEVLYKDISHILGEDFSPNMVLGILLHSKEASQKNPALKEGWLQASQTFRKPKPPLLKKA